MVKISFNEEICKGCGLCAGVCPQKIVIMKEDVINKKGYHPAGAIKLEKCTGCGFCAVICPDCAIIIEKGEDTYA